MPGDFLLYVSCAGTHEILCFAMDRQTGELTLQHSTGLPGEATSPPSGTASSAMRPSFSIPMAVSPGRGVLYAVLRTAPYVVLSYRIDARSGALELLGEAGVPDSTPYIGTDRSGRLLFGAAYQGNCVWVSAIGADGKVAGAPHQIVAGIESPHCVLAHPNNRFVYVAAAGGDEMVQFRLDAATGRLEPLDAPPVQLADGTRPRHLAFHPDGERLYCITEAHALVEVYAVDGERGALTVMPGLGSRLPNDPAAPYTVAADIHLTPDGRFLYGSERTNSTIGGFAVAPDTGALSLIDAWPTESIPRSFALDPAGRFLVAAGQESGRIAVYAIDPATGRLGECLAYDVGEGPGWIEIVDPSGEVDG
jgi:6-phosphogluconolactonase